MEVTNKFSGGLEKNILDLFWSLTDKNASVRIKTSLRILRFLQEKQKLDVQNKEFTVNLKYCLERLVKGLSSSRDAARLGFGLLLTAVLQQFTAIEIEEVLDLAKQHLSFASQQEKRDIVFGQLFLYSSIVRCGRLANHSHLSFVTLAIYDLWQSRTYVLNACYKILKDIFSQLSPETFKENLWRHLKKKFSSGWEECSPDNLWLLLLSARIFPDAVNEKYFQKHWNTSNIFSAENFENLKKLVRQTTSSLPNLHPLSSEIAIICSSGKNSELWYNVVDGNLFEGDNMERSFVGFEMIKSALQTTVKKKKLLKNIMAPKFSEVFAKSFLNIKSPLNSAASQLADIFSRLAIESNDSNIQLLVLKFFLQLPTVVIINNVLKQKPVSQLIQNLLPEGVKLYFEFLKNAVTNKNSNSTNEIYSMGSNKCVLITQIGSLVLHPSVVTDIDWRIHVIKFLLLNSFFTLQQTTTEIVHCEDEIEEMSVQCKVSFQHAFFKAVTSLHRIRKQVTPLQQSIECLLLLVEYSDQLMSASENICPQFRLEKVMEPWQQMKSIVHKLKKQSKKDGYTNESNAFMALFLELGFHLFVDFEHTSDVLEELHICCKRALQNRKSIKDQQVDGNEPPWICVVTDILLSLLSRSSLHLRGLVTSVFELLCPFINQDALQQILSVIDPEKSKDEPMLVEESDEEEELKFESGSSSGESDCDDSEMPDVDQEFKQKVKDVLGSAADASDNESIVLSDSDMFKLGDALSKAFREQKQTGPNQMKYEEKSLHVFRLRTLDLLTIYLKSDPPIYLALQIIEPVLAAFDYGQQQTSSNQKTLSIKSLSILEAITKLEFKKCESMEKSFLKKLLELIVAKCHKEVNMKIAKRLYAVSVFFVLCYRYLESSSSPEKAPKKSPFYLKTYVSALETFATGNNSNMFPQFFVSVMELCPNLAWSLIEHLKKYAFNSSIRLYRRTQCLGLLFEAIKFAKGETSVNNDQWIELGNDLIPKAVETLKVIVGESEGKPAYLSELLDVIYASHSVIEEKTNQSPLKQYSEELTQLLSNLPRNHEKRLAKKGRTVKNKIIQSLGGCNEHHEQKGALNSDPAIPIENMNLEQTDDTENVSMDSMHKKRKSTSPGNKNKKQR